MVEKVKWELKLAEARKLRSNSSEIIFQRIQLLDEVYQDLAFRDWCRSAGKDAVLELDKCVDDLPVEYNFLVLQAIYRKNPKRQTWIKLGLRRLYAALAEEQAKQRVPVEGERISWKARALAAERECERLREEIKIYKELLGRGGDSPHAA